MFLSHLAAHSWELRDCWAGLEDADRDGDGMGTRMGMGLRHGAGFSTPAVLGLSGDPKVLSPITLVSRLVPPMRSCICPMP